MQEAIIITSAGRRVALVKAFIKEVKSRNLNIRVFTGDANPYLSSACHVADSNVQLLRLNDENYITNLLCICLKNNIKLVVPTIDTEL